MANVTPVSAAIGGALIGLPTTLSMLFTGSRRRQRRSLAGCLGLAADKTWRIAFIAGPIPLIGIKEQLTVACQFDFDARRGTRPMASTVIPRPSIRGTRCGAGEGQEAWP